VFSVQPQNSGLLLRGLSDKDARDNAEHQPNTGKHQERKNLEINQNKCHGETTQQRLLTYQFISNNASCEILVTTYQITWYTMISKYSHELPNYSVTTHTTTLKTPIS